MQGMVPETARMWKLVPGDASRCRIASGERYGLGKFEGDLDAMQAGIDIATKCIALKPDDPGGYLGRAGEEQSLHRFAQARADLEKARTLKATADQITPIETELDWNDGKYAVAMPAILAALSQHASMMTVARVAQLDHDLGKMSDADRLFEQAEDLLPDANPVPLAWLYMQRGMHLVKIGKLEDAVTFFRAAIDRIPNVAEREHLAEALHWLGQDDEAQGIYEDIVKTSRDPEFMGALAAIYRGRGRAKDADALRAKATARYAELAAQYPEAMYWHASEYFMGEGSDPKKALALLQKNLVLRPNSTSYVALARAQLATGDAAGARVSVEKAIAMPLVSAELYWTAARVYAAAGDAMRRDDFAAKAKALNPIIEKTEPPIAPHG